MANQEEHSHTFVLKIWAEDDTSVKTTPIWRGHITHVPDGLRGYLKSVDDLVIYLRPFIEEFGGNGSRSRPPLPRSRSNGRDNKEGD